jgi:hypothetical protein
MTVREQRVRKAMLPEGAKVLVRLTGCAEAPEQDVWTAGVVKVVGWQTGTYRIRVGRQLHHVSLTQVRAA